MSCLAVAAQMSLCFMLSRRKPGGVCRQGERLRDRKLGRRERVTHTHTGNTTIRERCSDSEKARDKKSRLNKSDLCLLYLLSAHLKVQYSV